MCLCDFAYWFSQISSQVSELTEEKILQDIGGVLCGIGVTRESFVRSLGLCLVSCVNHKMGILLLN